MVVVVVEEAEEEAEGDAEQRRRRRKIAVQFHLWRVDVHRPLGIMSRLGGQV